MKTTFLSVFLVAVFCLQSFSQTTGSVEHPKRWMEKRFAQGVVPPFSFVYGGKKSDSFIRNWQYQSEKLPSTEPNHGKYLYTYSDKATGLQTSFICWQKR